MDPFMSPRTSNQEDEAEEEVEDQEQNDEDLPPGPPFTAEVGAAIAALHRHVADATDFLSDASRTGLAEAVSGLVEKFEQQVLLMFTNWRVEEAQRASYLKRRQGAVLTQMRQEMQEATATASTSPHKPPSPTPTPASPPASPLANPCTKNRKQATSADAAKAVSAGVSMHLAALAQLVGAQQAVLYLFDKTTSTLRSASAFPRPVNVSIPSHSGAQGGVYSSTVAFNISVIHHDVASFFKPADQQARRTTTSFLCFPVVDPAAATRAPLGVLELVNKDGGAGVWTRDDEAAAHHSCCLLFHLLRCVPHNVFSRFPGTASAVRDLLAAAHGGQQQQQQAQHHPVGQAPRVQLVFRPGDNELRSIEDTKALHKSTAAGPMTDMTNVREISNYLTTLEASYWRGLNKFAIVDNEKRELQEELTRKGQRVRVLEDNVAYLSSQVHRPDKEAHKEKEKGLLLNLNGYNVSAVPDETYESDGHEAASDRGSPSHRVSKLDEGGQQHPNDDGSEEHPKHLEATLALAQRLAPALQGTISGGSGITTALPCGTDHVLPRPAKGGKRNKPTNASLAVDDVRACRLSPSPDIPTSLSPQKYTLTHASYGRGRSALRRPKCFR